MPYFTNDGVKIYYELEGEGPPVIMIHALLSRCVSLSNPRERSYDNDIRP
jgi:hypothetical protein